MCHEMVMSLNNNFDKKISKLLSRLEDDRNNADYDFSFQSTEIIARRDLKNAKLFVKECKKFL